MCHALSSRWHAATSRLVGSTFLLYYLGLCSVPAARDYSVGMHWPSPSLVSLGHKIPGWRSHSTLIRLFFPLTLLLTLVLSQHKPLAILCKSTC